MATWTSLITPLLVDLTDPTGIFHPTATIQRHLEHAELLLTLRRSLYERTQTLLLSSMTPLYTIHTYFPDFIRPLRVTVAGVALRWSSLAAVSRLNRQWWIARAEPESVFMVGKTILGFAPFPDAESAEVTYLAAPPTSATPSASPVIDSKYHLTMKKYAEAVALGKEAEYQRAAAAMKEFMELANIERDERFLEGLSQNTAQRNTRQVERQAHD